MDYFQNGCNCSQAVVMPYAAELNVEEELIQKMAVTFGGGMSKAGKTCGCLSGALMVIGLKYGEDSENILNLKIKELVLYLLKGTSTEEILDFIYCCTEEIDDLCQYMEQNYEMCQDIPSIAITLNMSISTFKRKFIHAYGETPGKWITHKKLEKAIKLLDTTDYLITDICFLCGFESVSTFNVQFRKNFGMAPSQYSRKGRRKIN